MSDFSPGSENSFESVNLKNILTLISVLVSTELGLKSVIKQRFNQQATSFDETVAFLHTVGGIETNDKEIHFENDFEKLVRDSDNNAISGQVFDLILKTNNPYHSEITEYISKFQPTGGVIEYKPVDYRRGELSEVRNFLIDIGVLKYNYDTDKYVLLPEHIHLFAIAIDKQSSITPAKLKQRLIQKDKVGSAAELKILKYEKNRLGAEYERFVEHISVKNEAAGYDIKSVTVVGNSTEPRYIEVKAVPSDSYRFYWSQNEIRVAELMNSNYYLYLLPVKSKMEFATDKLKIISDPVPEILKNTDIWSVEPNVVCCSLNS